MAGRDRIDTHREARSLERHLPEQRSLDRNTNRDSRIGTSKKGPGIPTEKNAPAAATEAFSPKAHNNRNRIPISTDQLKDFQKIAKRKANPHQGLDGIEIKSGKKEKTEAPAIISFVDAPQTIKRSDQQKVEGRYQFLFESPSNVRPEEIGILLSQIINFKHSKASAEASCGVRKEREMGLVASAA